MEQSIDVRKVGIPMAVIGFLAFTITTKPFLYVTEPGEATVVFNSFRGLQKDRIEQPGVSLIMPIVERPISYNMRTQVLEFKSEGGISNAISVNSADGQAFSIDVYVTYRPNDLTLDDLHAEIGENYIDTVVIPVVRSKIRDISAQFDSEQFYQQDPRVEIQQQAEDLINQEMPTAIVADQATQMILVEGVFLGTPTFPPGLKSSIEEKQVASITAQTAAVRAEIQEKETERVLIAADADQIAIELQGQAAATNAQLSDLLFYERLLERIRLADTTNSGSPLQVIRVEGDATVFLNLEPRTAHILGSEAN